MQTLLTESEVALCTCVCNDYNDTHVICVITRLAFFVQQIKVNLETDQVTLTTLSTLFKLRRSVSYQALLSKNTKIVCTFFLLLQN